jgi:hypothetical protein
MKDNITISDAKAAIMDAEQKILYAIQELEGSYGLLVERVVTEKSYQFGSEYGRVISVKVNAKIA